MVSSGFELLLTDMSASMALQQHESVFMYRSHITIKVHADGHVEVQRLSKAFTTLRLGRMRELVLKKGEVILSFAGCSTWRVDNPPPTPPTHREPGQQSRAAYGGGVACEPARKALIQESWLCLLPVMLFCGPRRGGPES